MASCTSYAKGEWARSEHITLHILRAWVVPYLSDLAAKREAATLNRRISAISQAHQMAGHESPTNAAAVRTVMAGIRRAKGACATARCYWWASRVRSGASELVRLERADVEVAHEGVIIMLRRSKTDQEGAGRKVAIPYGANLRTAHPQGS